MFEFYLIIFLFPLFYSEIIIPISDFQTVEIPFKDGYCNYTLNYSIAGSKIFKDKKLLITTKGLQYNQLLFIYDDFEKLKADKEKYTFNNYIFQDYPSMGYEYYEKNLFNIYEDRNYYITFDERYHSYSYRDTFIFIFSICSTVYNSRISQTINFSDKKINFLFYVPSEHKKYVSFGFRNITNDILGELHIYKRNNLQLKHRVPKIDYFQFFFETEKNYDYLINLTLTSTSQNNDINKNFFYFLQTDNNDSIISLKANKSFQEFYVLKELNLILSLEDISKYFNAYIEYNREFFIEDSIKAYSYSDKSLISTTSGKEIELLKVDNCTSESRTCLTYIKKDDNDIKFVLLKITALKNNPNELFKISIKYGNKERYSFDSFILSTLMGIALSLPNIILYCCGKAKYNKDYLSKAFVFYDLFFFIGFSDSISLNIGIGGHLAIKMGIAILIINIIAFIIFNLYKIFIKKNDTQSGLIYFIKKLSLPTIEQAINENKRFQPCLKFKVSSLHKESREVCNKYLRIKIYGPSYQYSEIQGNSLVFKERCDFLREEKKFQKTTYSEWGRVDQGGGKFKIFYDNDDQYIYERQIEKREVETWSKTSEFKYNSWKDDTNYINNNNATILNVNFKTEFNFNDDTKKNIEDLKSELNEEAKPHDSETKITEIFTVPGLKKRVSCLPKNTTKTDILYLIISIIFSLFGYSTFVNFFVYYKEEYCEVTIKKSVASSNIYGNPYREININEDNYNISKENDRKKKAGGAYELLLA